MDRREGIGSSSDPERQLDELEEIYRSAPVGLCLLDTEFRFLRINERLAAINGCSAADHIGRTIEEVVPALADQILPRYRKVLETGDRIENVEVTDPRSDRTWLASDHPLKDARGRVTAIITVVQDVTVIARHERELRTVRERLRLAERVAHLGCWEWDLPNNRVWWSEETFRILGRDPAAFDATFDAFIESVQSEDRRRVREILDAVWAGQAEAETEFRVVGADDGQERHLRGIALLRRDDEGEPLFLFGTIQDISGLQAEREGWAEERARLEAERAELEALVRERTGALDRALDQLRRRRQR